MEKEVTYKTTNVYETLNTLTEKTRNIWMVFHGIGHLSRYFLRNFEDLPVLENYIIAPQAPSKYYLNDAYRHVGASWLTKEKTSLETENVMAYVNAVFEAEPIPDRCQLIVLGFSQGVSIATRWVARNHIAPDQLVLYAGGIPEELGPEDFDHLAERNTKVSVIVGDADPYLPKERMERELGKVGRLFRDKARQIGFEGGHEVRKELLGKLV